MNRLSELKEEMERAAEAIRPKHEANYLFEEAKSIAEEILPGGDKTADLW